jgi:hypothetical protein
MKTALLSGMALGVDSGRGQDRITRRNSPDFSICIRL